MRQPRLFPDPGPTPCAPRYRRVFVYGTLMRGFPNHWRLRAVGARFVGEATTRREWAMHARPNRWCPEVVPGTDAIRGEVYLIPRAALRTLDRHEGHPRVYYRSRERLADGTRADIYLFQAFPQGPYVAGGDWREYTRDARTWYGWHTTATAAAYLGLDVSRVRALCKAGRLGQKIGRNWAIPHQELQRFARLPRRPGRPRC